LSHAVMRATAASASVLPLTRVDQNIASGIARAVAETRASHVLIGWDGGRSMGPQAVFGSVLDQLLERTRTQVVVASLVRALSSVNRLVLILPRLANRHPGFGEAIRTVTIIAQQLAAPIHVLVVGDRVEPFERVLLAGKSAPSVHFAPPTTWRGLAREVEASLRTDDLAVLVSARPGTLPWHPRLERLPRMLANATVGAGEQAGSLLVVYPAESSGDDTGAVVRPVELPDYLSDSRVVADLPRLPFDRALERLLDT